MKRMFNLLEYALISLNRRRKKYIALILIYSIVVAFFSSVMFFTSSLKQETEVVLEEIPELWVQKITGGRLVPMKNQFVNDISNIRGIRQIVPRIWGYSYDTPTGAVLTITGSDSTFQGLELVKTLDKSPLQKGEAVCGTGFMEMRGLFLGERFTIQNSFGELHTFTIKGVFDSASDLLTKDLVILSPQDARTILGLKTDEYTDIGVSIYNADETANIGKKIDQQFGGIRVVTKEQLRSTYETLFSWRGGIFIYGSIISILAFLILAWDRAAGLDNEEKKELGILKGIGWEISDVLWVKFWEGFVISSISALTGILLAFAHVYIWQAPLLKPFLIGWSVMYPSYHLQPAISLGDLFMILSIAVIPYLSATIFPAWKGAITDPAEIMKG